MVVVARVGGDHRVRAGGGADLVAAVAQHRAAGDDGSAADHRGAAGVGGAVVDERGAGGHRGGTRLGDGDGGGAAAAGVVGVARVGGDHGVRAGGGADLVAA